MTDFAMSSAPNVGRITEHVPWSNALLNMNVRFQRTGGTTSYTTASLHQMKTCPFSIILLKKSWSSPDRNSALNGCEPSENIRFFSRQLFVRHFHQSLSTPVG